jgi:penicillin-binding protein 1A
MSAAESYVMTSMLRSVVTAGTARAARRLPFSVAGKTGTSNEARDAWFIGYSSTRVASVWVGFDDQRPLGRREGGGRSALPIWVDVMRHAHRGRRTPGFAVPSGITEAQIDPDNGLLAYEGMEEPLTEIFVVGTQPTEVSRPPEVADPSTFLMEEFEDEAPAETAATP